MKLKTAVVALAAVAAVAASATPARAWDELGHRVVARIAWDHMTPQARANAVRLLMAGPLNAGLRELMGDASLPMEERQRELFVMAAYWPDLIRLRTHPGYRFAHSDWHYVNHFWEQRPDGSRVDRPDVPRLGFLLDQLTRIRTELADASRADSLRAVDLAWALHLAGDVHQPLHNNARITAQDPEGDRGGNSYQLAGIYPYSNLHAFWDGLLGMSFAWRPGDRTEADYIGGIAEAIAARHPRARMAGRIAPGEFEAWSIEGFRVAQAVAYDTPRGERPSLAYGRRVWRAAEPRVALAGYRLADLLNTALGS